MCAAAQDEPLSGQSGAGTGLETAAFLEGARAQRAESAAAIRRRWDAVPVNAYDVASYVDTQPLVTNPRETDHG